MPQAQQKQPSKRSIRDAQRRVKAAQKEITAILQKHNVVLTARRVKVFREEENRLRGGDAIEFSTLVHMCGLPANTVLMAWIQLAPGAPSPNGK